MVGIIHPCKIYGAMSAGKPILFLGPRPSHISDLLEKHGIGLQISHGDLAGAMKAIETFRGMSGDQLVAMGELSRKVLDESLNQKLLCGRFCDAIEKALRV
jgi:colanic acid biosynthesis glycosyl transferase WcaI